MKTVITIKTGAQKGPDDSAITRDGHCNNSTQFSRGLVRGGLLLALLATVFVVSPPAARASANKGAQVFRFAQLDRGYANQVPLSETINQDPLVITLTSPRQSLILRSHQLELRPRSDGSHDAELVVSFLGKGWLVADAGLAGMTTRLEDELLLPIQSQTVRARVELVRVEGGYTFTARELPANVPVKIESRLIGGLLDWCNRLAFLPGSTAGCDQLEQSLSVVEVPMPAAGTPYFLADSELRPSDRDQLDAYLLAAWSQKLSSLPRLDAVPAPAAQRR